MRRAISLWFCVVLLSGCVSAASYEAERSRAAALTETLAQREARIRELEQGVRKMRELEENLELSRSSFDSERARLLDEMENQRMAAESLQEQLAAAESERERQKAELENVSGTYKNLIEQLEGEVQQGNIEVERLRGQLTVRALDQILFDSGSAEIKARGKQVLAGLADQIKKIEAHTVRVDGHTDDRPISNARFPSNWELSSARAVTVVRFFADKGIPPDRLSVGAFGPFQPIADNGSAEGRKRNRRIEIVLVPITPGGAPAEAGD
jgi:chemotaxis protein MotB